MFAVIIPFRDRGTDPLRTANLKHVLQQWNAYRFLTLVVSDGRDGDQQFNRSAAYNHGAALTDMNVLVFAESDMLINSTQIEQAVELATQQPGLVVPYTQYRALSQDDSEAVRDGADPAIFIPDEVIPNNRRHWPRTGPINVISKQTLNMVGGYDETFDGSWWDDRAMLKAFETCCGPTRFVQGPAYHLYHLPGWKGPHLTTQDKQATAANQRRYRRYMAATTPEQIRQLTHG